MRVDIPLQDCIEPFTLLCRLQEGKQIYAWTVNKEATMQTMIAMQVDGIVTDNPTLLKKQMAHLNDHYIMFINQLFFRPS